MRILGLFPKHYWDHKMSPGRRDVLARVATVVSGQGWDGWDDTKTLGENVEVVMPYAEAIIWYKPWGSEKDGIAPIRSAGYCPLPKVMIYNEAWWPDRRAYHECVVSNTDLAIHHHLADAAKFEGFPRVHIPHCANQDVYARAAKPWSERSGVLVVGALDGAIYPLRTRVAQLIRAGAIKDGKVRSHPGYRLGSSAQCLAQQQDFASELGSAKIVVCCASKYNYGLAKYVEAAMAGACVAGDIPPDFEGTIGPHMLPLDARWSDDQIASAINAGLQRDDEIYQAAKFGQQAALQYHNIDGYCQRLVGAIDGFRAGWWRQKEVA